MPIRLQGIALLTVTCLVTAPYAIAADRPAGNLASATWLAQHLDNPELLVLDASPGPIYKAKHIPGAISVDLMSWYGIREMTTAESERLYQSWGVSPGKKIVMYDQGGTFLATRLFFSFYYHSFPASDLLVLDGGLAKWQELGFPVTAEATAPPAHGSFRIVKVNEDVRVRLPEFLTASGDPAGNALVEGLGPEWHFGEVAPFERPGHPPNGILMPSADFFNSDKTFKSPEEITRMATYLGVRPDQNIYSYCGGGVAASVPFFALKFMANYPHVKLYKESELGWLSDERGLPYWTYDAPLLMRDAKWLQFWAGAMIRTVGGGQVTVVDIRPTSAFTQGHIAFAVNVPSDAFKDGFTHPATLAGALSPAGVDPSHEAVVVSGAGFTKDAALAFVALEKLGQKKVSILMDPAEVWSARGLKVTTDATSVVRPISYAREPRQGVVVADAKASRGVYPKVFIASGASVPAQVPAGTVVHVPYTDLIGADGTPKPAKDLWKILTKAGVPRYAELVCFSDDPGEAAVTYVVLKLMGFPDIKVLISPSPSS